MKGEGTWPKPTIQAGNHRLMQILPLMKLLLHQIDICSINQSCGKLKADGACSDWQLDSRLVVRWLSEQWILVLWLTSNLDNWDSESGRGWAEQHSEEVSLATNSESKSSETKGNTKTTGWPTHSWKHKIGTKVVSICNTVQPTESASQLRSLSI